MHLQPFVFSAIDRLWSSTVANIHQLGQHTHISVCEFHNHSPKFFCNLLPFFTFGRTPALLSTVILSSLQFCKVFDKM